MMPETAGNPPKLQDLLRKLRSEQRRCSVGKLSNREVELFHACVQAIHKAVAKIGVRAEVVAQLAGRTTSGEYIHDSFGATEYTGPFTRVMYRNRDFVVGRVGRKHTWEWDGASGQPFGSGVTIILTIWAAVDSFWIHRLRSTIRKTLERRSVASVSCTVNPASDLAVRLRFHVRM
jgi:hypothetical protein